jgi:hypothetical protein
MHQLGKPERLVANYLASDETSYAFGQMFTASDGYPMK